MKTAAPEPESIVFDLQTIAEQALFGAKFYCEVCCRVFMTTGYPASGLGCFYLSSTITHIKDYEGGFA